MGRAKAVTMERYAVFLRRDQLARLRAIHEEAGVPIAEQIRRALDVALGTRPGRKGVR